MNQSDKRIAELEEIIQQLTTENDQLAERAEDTLLLGQIADAIANQDSMENILSMGLENISLLKDIPACLALQRQDNDYQIIGAYLSYTDKAIRNLSIHLPEDIEIEQLAGKSLLRSAWQTEADLKDVLPSGMVIGQSIWIGCTSQHFPGGVFVYVLENNNGARGEMLQTMLLRVSEMIGHAIERLKILSSLKQLNTTLDQRVEARTLELKESEDRFRALVDQAPDSIFMIGDDGRFIDVNRTATIQLGYSYDELLGMTVPEIDSSFTLEGIKHITSHIQLGGSVTLEGEHQRKDGSIFPVEIHVSKIQLSGNITILAVARDVSERVQAEAAIRIHQRAMDAATNGIVITDATLSNMPIIYCNHAVENITGYTASELIGKNCRILQGSDTDQSVIASMRQAIADQKECCVTLRNYRKNGKMFWNEVTLSPVFDEQGKLTEYVGIQSDVSREHELEEQLAQSQKMEAIGTLVGGIAHDFNNMLAGMMGNLYLMIHDNTASSEVKIRAERIHGLCERAASMISQMLAFARKGHLDMQPMDFTAFIEEALGLARLSIPENINVETNIQHNEECFILGDPTRLQQVLLNLMVNARDAVEEKDEPVIRIAVQVVGRNKFLNERYDGLGEGPWVHLSVADNGSGIPDSVIEHIYEPFFTTKGVGKGTGLGLSMVYGVVQSHQGAIHLESDSQRGSCFNIYLPLSGSRDYSSVASDDLVRGDGETILLVDDELIVRDSGKELLELLGYQVELASNGREALEHDNLADIDLILMDVVMPELGGVDAVRLIRKQHPELPVLFATGYDHGEVLQEQGDIKNSKIISKPFHLHALSKYLHTLLHTSTGLW